MDETLQGELLQIVRLRLLEEYPAHVRACLQSLDESQIWWRPHEGANAVANLVLHVAGSNRFYLGHAIAGQANVRDREAEFAVRGGVSKADLQQIWDDTAALVTRVLGTLTPNGLGETTGRTGRTSSFARILLHVTHHNSLHVGQIVWVTKMLRPGVLQELTRGGSPQTT